jgi:hypothetical protein
MLVLDCPLSCCALFPRLPFFACKVMILYVLSISTNVLPHFRAARMSLYKTLLGLTMRPVLPFGVLLGIGCILLSWLPVTSFLVS